MLIVRAEIWPGGDGRCRYPVGEIVAANESELAAVSAYCGAISQEPAPHIVIEGWRREFTLSCHRRNSGVWPLVAAILSTVLVEERGDRQ